MPGSVWGQLPSWSFILVIARLARLLGLQYLLLFTSQFVVICNSWDSLFLVLQHLTLFLFFTVWLMSDVLDMPLSQTGCFWKARLNEKQEISNTLVDFFIWKLKASFSFKLTDFIFETCYFWCFSWAPPVLWKWYSCDSACWKKPALSLLIFMLPPLLLLSVCFSSVDGARPSCFPDGLWWLGSSWKTSLRSNALQLWAYGTPC